MFSTCLELNIAVKGLYYIGERVKSDASAYLCCLSDLGGSVVMVFLGLCSHLRHREHKGCME